MIRAELRHNPYLLNTEVEFNGQPPRINSQIEKYQDIILKDWIDKVPKIFYDEMNGYDFDLDFMGTKSDYESLKKVFVSAKITDDMVRLFHKNELEDAETKSKLIDTLVKWLKENPNRKFDYNNFYNENEELLDGSYSYVVLNGQITDDIHPQVHMEFIDTAEELQNTYLINTPILFFISPTSRKEFRKNLAIILDRKDVKQNQLFFMIHPELNQEQVTRIISDLGVVNPQIVSSYDDELVIKYIENYPITEFVRDAIKIFESEIKGIAAVLEDENEKSEAQNAEIHAMIDGIEAQITRIKESDHFFTDRDNFSGGYVFGKALDVLRDQVSKWRIRKTKVVGDSECEQAAKDYDADISTYMATFIRAVNDAYIKKGEDIFNSFKENYMKQGLENWFQPEGICLQEVATCEYVTLAKDFIGMKVVTMEEQKLDIKAFLRMTAPKEEKELVRVATCYYDQWRSKAVEHINKVADEYIGKNLQQLENYYNELAEAFHTKLCELMDVQEKEKDSVAEQLSDDERKLQEDNDWFAEFKEQLTHIERG